MLTGSYGCSAYGMGRASQDIDLVIAAGGTQIKKLLEQLSQNSFYAESNAALEACRRKSMFNAIDNITVIKVDFIFRKDRNFSQEEFRRRKTALVQGVQLSVATAEDIVISKLEWAKIGESGRQIEDVVGILKIQGTNLDRPYIEKWVQELDLCDQWERARQLAGVE